MPEDDVVTRAEAIVAEFNEEFSDLDITLPVEPGMCTVRTGGVKCPNKADGTLLWKGVATTGACIDHAEKILVDFHGKGWCFRA